MNTNPTVMCLTNTVAAHFTANCLLAVGARPAMIEEASEAAELAAVADAVLVNVGTLTPDQAAVMEAAIAVCRRLQIPWVLDPVAVHILAFRRQFVLRLLADPPALIRGNRTEIDFLANVVPGLSARTVLLATGEMDEIRSGERSVTISGGTPMLARVTATGCAQGALAAAALGRGLAPYDAAHATSLLMKRAGERALVRSRQPGGFRDALVDALYELGGEAFP